MERYNDDNTYEGYLLEPIYVAPPQNNYGESSNKFPTYGSYTPTVDIQIVEPINKFFYGQVTPELAYVAPPPQITLYDINIPPLQDYQVNPIGLNPNNLDLPNISLDQIEQLKLLYPWMVAGDNPIGVSPPQNNYVGSWNKFPTYGNGSYAPAPYAPQPIYVAPPQNNYVGSWNKFPTYGNGSYAPAPYAPQPIYKSPTNGLPIQPIDSVLYGLPSIEYSPAPPVYTTGYKDEKNNIQAEHDVAISRAKDVGISDIDMTSLRPVSTSIVPVVLKTLPISKNLKPYVYAGIGIVVILIVARLVIKKK